MTALALVRRINARSWRLSMRREQVAVSLINGGMLFCDTHVERAYFADDV
ncbi:MULTISPECIES: hypothetical protein [unclassified Caballeronia]|nr:MULTISPECIES: hypothetical protein [unclassified Caballeronia]MDR5776901.1 hypothetical protein [Caballeronia sp. LZ002]MDR5798793.1 hypothetical protein [Caballeronia sp. LZ001]MDR5852314.1 hypothetical protein [Caballeronia sp. LZ003]